MDPGCDPYTQWPVWRMLGLGSLTGYIVSLFLETLLFDAFTVTYTISTWSLLRTLASRGRSTRDLVLLSASTTMFGLALAHIALSLKITLFGFVTNGGCPELVDDAMLASSVWSLSSVGATRLEIYVTQTLIGDAFMIHRFFLVWNRSRNVIILPVISCFSSAVGGYSSLVSLILGVSSPLAFFSLSFTSNVLCSVLIIWRVLRSTNQYTPLSARIKIFQKIAEAIVQSAAIYATASVALALTFFLNPHNKPGVLVCLDVFPPLIGLVFSFIILRMARSSAEDAA